MVEGEKKCSEGAGKKAQPHGLLEDKGEDCGLWKVAGGWQREKEDILGAKVGGMGKLPIRKWSGCQWTHRLWPGKALGVLGGGMKGVNVCHQGQCNKVGGMRI